MPVFPLYEGAFTVDDSKKFIPFTAGLDDLKNRPASLLVDIVPFLIKLKNDLIIIDPGLGHITESGEYQIQLNISNAGFSAGAITKVLISHLHKDHAGGIAYSTESGYQLMFPNAEYFVQQAEMDFALQKTSNSYEQEKLKFLLQSKNLTFLKGDGNINNEIKYEVINGHTPYHQSFLISDGVTHYYYAGDVLPQPQQLQRKFIAKYDYDGKAASVKRIEIGKAAAQNHWQLLFFHWGALSVGSVTYENGIFKVTKIL
jgi:glyoxylase-like metal-dependent hydrolase (beta-lactamase superfamily II)